jgi:hypothetical protein
MSVTIPSTPNILRFQHTGNILDGLIGHWALEDAGITQTDSLGLNPMTQYGTVQTQQTGKFNYGITFNNTDRGIIRIPGTIVNGKIIDKITVSFWIKLDSLPTEAGAFFQIIYGSSTYGGSQAPIQCYISSSSDRMVFGLNQRDNVYKSSISTVITNKTSFFHVFLISTGIGGTTKIYFNNVDESYTTGSLTDNIMQIDNLINIGNTGNLASSPIIGTIDDICIFNRALNEDERAYIYNSGIGRTYPFV